MRRLEKVGAWGIVGVVIAIATGSNIARAQGPEELARTAAYVAALQNKDGGFAAEAGGRSTLGATSTSIRVLKNVAGSVRDVPGALAFVRN
ncbi:MAG TPA: hypothetical protein VG406_01730, partial [Isosphaeraceae bacterium]|nr:hypothetical protein [Isosphaeraceae bacterium]